MRLCAIGLVLAIAPCSAWAVDAVFEGSWNTTNRKLDGSMTCAVSDLGSGKWQGRFYGVWQGVPFDYTVAFAGSPSDLSGTATIDGANYEWKGRISQVEPRSFKGSFGGNRYIGHFDLREKELQEKDLKEKAKTAARK